MQGTVQSLTWTGRGRLRFKAHSDSRARVLQQNTMLTRRRRMMTRMTEGTRQRPNHSQSEGLQERKLGCMDLAEVE